MKIIIFHLYRKWINTNMNASDDEFEQYLNELNDIVETVVLWITFT